MFKKRIDNQQIFIKTKLCYKKFFFTRKNRFLFRQIFSFLFVLIFIYSSAFTPGLVFADTSVVLLNSKKKNTPTLLFSASKTSRSDFSAYIQTELVKPYSEYQLDKIRTSPRPIKLKELLQKAQMDFLSPAPETSKKTFQKITHHLHSFDWNQEERKILFYALLRLAQLEKDKQDQKILLQEAAIFSLDLKLDWEIFPPPLAKEYLAMQQNLSVTEVFLNKIFPLHEVILINGKYYSQQEKVKLPFGVYRITALSSSYESFSQTLPLSRLISTKIQTKNLVSGDCHNAVLNIPRLPVNPIRVLFPNFCIWDSTQKPSAVIQSSFPNPAVTVTKQIQKKQKEKNTSQWQTQEWVLLLLGVAGITGLYFLMDSEKEKSQKPKRTGAPIVTIGF